MPGITNGIDIEEWNPATDKYLASQYSLDDISGKVHNLKLVFLIDLNFSYQVMSS